jgi:hypothetical protein
LTVGERGALTLEVSFGPSRSRRITVALARARRAGVDLEEIEPGRWRARFGLAKDQRVYGSAWAVLSEVRFLVGTTVDVDGSPESPYDASAMAYSARTWLRSWGSCGQSFPLGRPFPYCFLCPLLDPERAGVPVLGIPDTLPDDWA